MRPRAAPTSRLLEGGLLVFALASLGGCRVHEYVVARDEAPLYAGPALDALVDKMPLGHHDLVDSDGEEVDSAVRVRFRGTSGWAKRSDVRLFHYVSPELDGGADRDETVTQEVREVAVAHAGTSWTAEMRDAVREGRVLSGMTREQVELAWGWPRTIEALATPLGGERWIYRRRGYEVYCAPGDAGTRFRPTPRIDGAPGGGYHYHGRSSYARVPLVEERVVEFDGAHVVVRSFVRRYHDTGGGPAGDEP